MHALLNVLGCGAVTFGLYYGAYCVLRYFGHVAKTTDIRFY
ncbi:hypothetical protein [Paraburkholderia flagellata]|nr:hypothetical protein [Paraburkholderia flagellata]